MSHDPFKPGTRVQAAHSARRGILTSEPDDAGRVYVRWDNRMGQDRTYTRNVLTLTREAHLSDCRQCDGSGVGAHHGNCAFCAGTGKRPTCDHCGEQEGVTLRHTGRCDCTPVPIPLKDCDGALLRKGDRVEYVGTLVNFRGTQGTVQADGPVGSGRWTEHDVKVAWDTGYTATPQLKSLRRVASAVETPLGVRERTVAEKRAYLAGFRAGGDQMERCLSTTRIDARKQFNRIAEAIEDTA